MANNAAHKYDAIIRQLKDEALAAVRRAQTIRDLAEAERAAKRGFKEIHGSLWRTQNGDGA